MIRAILTSGSMRSLRHKPDRSCATKPGHISCHRHQHGMRVENFGNADNLMIDACLAEQGHPLVRVNVADGDLYRDLRGFEECLRLAAKELLTTAAPVSNR